jgi:tungstate transport system permease protein
MDQILTSARQALALLAGTHPLVIETILLSLRVSGLALAIAVLVGLPCGAALGLARFRFRGFLVALVYTGFALPPVVVGLIVYMLLSRSGPLGALELLFTPAAMVIAQAILALPYVTGITLSAVQSIPADARLQAKALGASDMRATLLHLREARLGLVAAVVAGFGAVISEVGAVMLVGGNISGETRVMTTAILLETRRGNYSIALAFGIVLLLIAFAVNLLLARLQQGRAWSGAAEGANR